MLDIYGASFQDEDYVGSLSHHDLSAYTPALEVEQPSDTNSIEYVNGQEAECLSMGDNNDKMAEDLLDFFH